MARVYTREEIAEMVLTALETPETLYQAKCVNYTGVTGGGRYTDIAAEVILENLANLDAIPKISRENYKVESHEELAAAERRPDSKRDEEWLAKGLYRQTLNKLGEVLDYQVPLKSKLKDAAGKIDLLSFNRDEGIAYIIELKMEETDETLLRCALESYTYWKTVDEERLLTSYGLPADTELRKTALVYKNSQPYRDFEPEGTAVRRLMRALGVDFFVFGEAEGYRADEL